MVIEEAIPPGIGPTVPVKQRFEGRCPVGGLRDVPVDQDAKSRIVGDLSIIRRNPCVRAKMRFLSS